MNFYEVLGISKDATEDQIKKAYRTLVFKFHPDRNLGDKEAEENFKKVQEAYEVLIDPQKRAEYDRFGTVGRQQHGHNPFQNIWEDFFGGGQQQDRGRSIQIHVEVELEEVLTGTKKPVKLTTKVSCDKCAGNGFTDWQPCNACSGSGKAFLKISPFNIFTACQVCRGTGRNGTIKCDVCQGTNFKSTGDKVVEVKIPAGIETGMQIRLIGEGEPGLNGTKNGDVIVILVVKNNDLYVRQGRDIIIEVPVSYTQLVLGDKVTIPSLDSKKIDFEIPPGTQSGAKFRIKGFGLPDLNGSNRGDLIASVCLEVPMTTNYRNVLEALAKCEKENITPKRNSFNKKVKQ